MRIAGTFQVVNGQNVIQGRPEDQPNAPLGVYPINAGDTILLCASTQLGMGRRLLQTSAVATTARDSALVRHQSQPRRLCAVACRVVFIAEC